MKLDRDGVALHVVEEGAGEPVVLLHGHTLDLRVWDDVAPALVAAGRRVIRYDLRGHGRSASPPCGYRYGDHAADLAAVIREVGRESAHVVGLSKGGGVAVELALREPALLRSLALVGPILPDYPLSPELLDSFRRFARAIRAAGVEQAAREVWLGHPLIASAYALERVRERLAAMVLAFPAGEYLATARDAPDREWRAIDRLAEIAAPTLVIRGEHDVPDFAAMSALVREQIPGARLEVVAGSGHLVPLERPEALVQLLLSFLEQVAVPAGAT